MEMIYTMRREDEREDVVGQVLRVVPRRRGKRGGGGGAGAALHGDLHGNGRPRLRRWRRIEESNLLQRGGELVLDSLKGEVRGTCPCYGGPGRAEKMVAIQEARRVRG